MNNIKTLVVTCTLLFSSIAFAGGTKSNRKVQNILLELALEMAVEHMEVVLMH